jgi:hypothetical protein
MLQAYGAQLIRNTLDGPIGAKGVTRVHGMPARGR